ncbi:MAG: ParB/RepB/Spo0J family partition protein [Leptolyngbya sp. SIO1E4]|nr:ParB/RepB/Spo0J family partition protein [Leptolyngbya sp. SIO1E4]
MAQKRQATQQPIFQKFQQVGATQAGQIQQRDEEIAQLRQQLEELQKAPASSGGITQYPIQEFVPLRLREGLTQPRKYFDPAAMEKLKQSIAKVGVREPLLVRRGADDKLEIVSGESRWRCSEDLNLETLPAIESDLNDEQALEIALISNLIRENLNLVEETDSIIALIGLKFDLDSESLSQALIRIKNLRRARGLDDEQVVEEMGDYYSGIITLDVLSQIDRIFAQFGLTLESFVTNRLIALQKMPEKLLEAVREGRVAFSKADVIRRSNLPSEVQEDLLREAEEGLAKSTLLERVKELKQTGSSNDSDAEVDPPQQFRQSAQKLYNKKAWKRIQADSKLKKKFQRLQSLTNELIAAIQD